MVIAQMAIAPTVTETETETATVMAGETAIETACP
jgi:hypothetical protein